MLGTIALVLSVLTLSPAVFAFDYKDYDNDFLDPSYVLNKNFNASTAAAQQSIIEWADVLAEQGPWSVMNKSVLPPTGSKHDYLSWAPYFWPNCTGVGNTTELTPQQIWVQCPYYERDGMFNPDRLFVNDTGNFQAMSDAVFYNTLAWVLTGSSNYSANAAYYLDTWFINPDTAMTPNLQYSQMERGPKGQIGTHTGLLDLRQFAKIASAIMILRNGSSPDWTSQLNTQMNNWTTNYIEWVITSPIAYGEWTADNNHGTYFYNQLASLYIIVDNKQNATNTINQYFSKQYLSQIQASGEQPLEAVRTHPYHYRCYNLAAMVTNAKIGKFLGIDAWNITTSAGATIQTAADFTMTVTLNTTDGDGPIWELYPSLAAVAANYGDPKGKYSSFMAQADSSYPAEPYFLFNQYFTDSGLAAATPTAGGPIPTETSAKTNAATSLSSVGSWVTFILLSTFTLLG